MKNFQGFFIATTNKGLKTPYRDAIHRWRGEKGRFASPFLVSSYTESTLTLVAEGACKAAMQRGPFPWTKP